MKLLNAVVLLSIAASLVFGQTDRDSTGNGALMPLSEVRAGMKGVSKTVFSGAVPERFDVEILGVVPGMIGPRQDMIICRISGGEADRTAVFAGMSGSPVHIDGKLVGSISFAFPFSKEPICGITPIDYILAISREEKKESGPESRSFSFSELYARSIGDLFRLQRGVSGVVPSGTGLASPLAVAAGQTFRPISLPLSYSGVSSRAMELFSNELSAVGLMPVAAPGGTAPPSGLKTFDDGTLTGGTSVSVQLARGDFSLAASGTVTLRDGEKVYAFGHPFLSLGGVDMPMSESTVVTVVPSMNNSFKLAVPGEMVGTMTQDRATGVFGRLGATPKMIPVTIDLVNSRGQRETSRFETVTDEFLSTLLVNIGVINILFSNERNIGDTTVDLKGEISLKGGGTVAIDKRYSGPAAAALASMAVSTPVNLLLRSRFENLEIERVRLRISVAEGASNAVLERISADKTEVRPGDELKLSAFVRGSGGRIYRENFIVRVPEDTQPGQLTLTVADGAETQQGSAVQQFTPRTLSELVMTLNKARRDDRLYVQLSRASSGAVSGATEMPNLPPSVLATINSGGMSGGFKPTTSQVLVEKELAPAEFVISGKQTMEIVVVRGKE